MKKYFHIVVLLTITLLSFVLRAHSISTNPPSLSWDEVSIGYNAYSILKTGKDEHEKTLPLDAFVGYGDYKPPLAIYTTVPFVAIFGLNEFAVRLPSALSGTLTVFLTYFLVIELFVALRDKDKKSNHVSTLSLLSAFLLAISPWHINISRAGFEANIALLFVVLGIVLILRAFTRPRYWYWAWLPFVASIYTFNSSRYFVPMFGLVLCIYARKHIRMHWKPFMAGIVLAGMCMLPIIPHLLSKEARLRFAEVNIFTDASVVTKANERIAVDNQSPVGKFFDNRRVGYTISYLRHFADNLQPSFLFVRGDGNPKFSIQEVGQLYAVEAIFLFVGMLSLSSHYPQLSLLLLLWMLLAIAPAAVARETPHALRILDTLPTWQIYIAFGIVTVIGKIKQKAGMYSAKIGRASEMIAIVMVIAVYIFSLSYYLHNYYAHYAKEYSGEWQYGYREAIQYAQSVADTYDAIYISEVIGRPYMYTLFYTQYDPVSFWRSRNASFDAAGFYHVYGFGKYRFIEGLPAEGVKPKELYIVNPGWVPQGAQVLKTIETLDGYKQLVIFER